MFACRKTLFCLARCSTAILCTRPTSLRLPASWSLGQRLSPELNDTKVQSLVPSGRAGSRGNLPCSAVRQLRLRNVFRAEDLLQRTHLREVSDPKPWAVGKTPTARKLHLQYQTGDNSFVGQGPQTQSSLEPPAIRPSLMPCYPTRPRHPAPVCLVTVSRSALASGQNQWNNMSTSGCQTPLVLKTLGNNVVCHQCRVCILCLKSLSRLTRSALTRGRSAH